MKWPIVLIAAGLLLAALVFLPRKSVHAELLIRAEPMDLWATITDPTSYSEWNPIFQTVDGVFAEGATMKISMRLADGSFAPVEAVVERMVPDNELHQRAGIPGILTADHRWLLEPASEGTRVIQQEVYRGIGALFYDPSYVEVLYREGLAALKHRHEGDAP